MSRWWPAGSRAAIGLAEPPDAAFDRAWHARFERFGRRYHDEHAVSGWSRDGLARRARLFGRVVAGLAVRQRAAVLELGCGAGTYVRYLAGVGHRVVGVDYSLPTLQRALDVDPGGHYAAADGYALPFAPGVFDLVTCIGVLQASNDPARLVGEMARVLRPGGLVVVEALNARGVPALARRLREIAASYRPRVRPDAPARARGWLASHGIELVSQVPLYVPPRRLARALDHAVTQRIVRSLPGVSGLAAHAFWLVGRKRP